LIAGIPPFNGYVSLSLIHQGLQQVHETVPYILTLAAQVITIAALGRAAGLAFFRPRAGEYQWREQLRPGMLAGLGPGGALHCVRRRRLDRAPQADGAGRRQPAEPGTLRQRGACRDRPAPLLRIPFDYLSSGELISVAVSIVVAAAAAWEYLRIREPLPVRGLRALHTGSANDYAVTPWPGWWRSSRCSA
jgi:multicomponent Na+:H+ antiporter subunit D